MKIFVPTFVFACLLTVVPLAEGQTPDRSQDEQAIRNITAAYGRAFNQGDAKALAALWAPDGEYVDQTATLISGRDEIEHAFGNFFDNNKGLKLNIKADKIGVVNDELAFEMGSTNVSSPDGKSRTTQFSANFVNRNGKWMLLSVHELPNKAPSQYDHLKGLEWLTGNWTTRDPGNQKPGETVIAVSCFWSGNQNFLIREFSCATDGKITNMGTQRIGWHAPTKTIRSWSFDNKGGSIMGVWKPDGKKWIVNTEEALNNGQELTSVEILSQGSNGEQVWQVTDQLIGEQAFPDKTYTFRRQN
ncbi:MAG: SgcJ/EcaC family oxidoreductase [Mariniblastus sp.]|nr:SgcJ/EcaC family oxidoreductase [Mariniblastus sp.]